MANDTHKWPTLAKLVQMREGTVDFGKIFDQIVYDTPFLDDIPSYVVEGTNVTEMVAVSYPLATATPFNSGVMLSESDYETRNFETKPYSSVCAIDTKLITANPKMAGEFMVREIMNKVRGFKATMERTLFYGDYVSPYGAKGMINLMGDFMTMSADSAHNSTATRQHGGMSVWAAHVSPETMKMLYSGSKAVSFGPEKRETIMKKTADGKDGMMEAVTRHMNVCPGVALLNNCAVARMVNVSADKPLTDSLLAELVNIFPTGLEPNVIYMSRQARYLLQQSRASKYVYQKKTSGATADADMPKEYLGLPIKVTSALINDETLQNLDALRNDTRIKAEQGGGKIER